jgi:hypothetical protein
MSVRCRVFFIVFFAASIALFVFRPLDAFG